MKSDSSREPLINIWGSPRSVGWRNWNFRPSGLATTPAAGRVVLGEIPILPGPRNLNGCLVFERNGHGVAITDVWFGGNIHDPIQRTGSWQFPHKFVGIHVCMS